MAAGSVDLDDVDPTDYGVHVEYLGNLIEVLILRPTGSNQFTLSCDDALDLSDEITAWAETIGAK
jgi:hypothetical protein